jgi:hypothetical protein
MPLERGVAVIEDDLAAHRRLVAEVIMVRRARLGHGFRTPVAGAYTLSIGPPVTPFGKP